MKYLAYRRSACLSIVCISIFWASSAWASAHTFVVNEIFSNPDGTIQFVELREALGFNNQNLFATRALDSTAANLVFGSNLPSATTASRHVLIGTVGFAALPGAPTPDYTLPDGFVDVLGDSIRFCDNATCITGLGVIDSITFASLPTDGITSLGPGATTATNSPTNFAGTSGSVSSPAGADWTEDFDGGFDQTWTFLAIDDEGDSPSTGVSEFDIIDAGADDYLRISHSTTAVAGGGGGATDGFGYVSESFTEASISADINATPGDGQQNILGVFGRGSLVAGTAYVAGIDFANSSFAIVAADNFFDSLFVLASDTSVVIDPSETYRVELYMIESSLSARLIEVSSGDIMSILTTEDSFYTSGFSGLLVETEFSGVTPVAPIIGTFDNVQAVPEPSMMSLIGWGVGGLLLLRRGKLP